MRDLTVHHFRRMCLEILGRDGTRNGNVWRLEKFPLIIVYDAGYLVVQDISLLVTVWNDRMHDAMPTNTLKTYLQLVERWLVLERLADV